MDTAHYISPFAISLRLMVDTHRVTRERRPRVAGCIPSVVLTNVRPKIRLTGPGPAFTSPPLQQSPAPFLVSRRRRSSRSAFNFNTYVRNLTQRALNNRRTHSQLETNENFARRRNTSVTVGGAIGRTVWESTHATYVQTLDTWPGSFCRKLDRQLTGILEKKSERDLLLLTNGAERLLSTLCIKY